MHTDFYVHPSAVVDDGAQIGKDTHIWHFCHIRSSARVGDRCNIGQNVYIDADVEVGDGVKIQNNVSLFTGVVIENDAFVGPSVVFTNVINPRSFIERKSEFKSTRVRRGASIGANATILCGLEIGPYALVGAGAVVVRNVPPHALVVGNPAECIGWVSRSGERLDFDETGKAWCDAEGSGYVINDGLVVMSE